MDRKIVLVSGGAKGIGKAIVERLCNEKYYCIIVDTDKNAAEALLEQIGNDKSAFFSCDISSEKEVSNLFAAIKNTYGYIYGLVNNAGIIRDKMIWKMDEEDFDAVIKVNLKGSWLMCKHASVMMREANKGRIVNIASRGWLGNIGQSNYAASKGGIVSLTRVLALELGKNNILVNAIAPGLIDTPMTQSMNADDRQRLIDAQPTKSMGTPADVAHAVSFLISEQTKFITGQLIYVDGGKSIGAGI